MRRGAEENEGMADRQVGLGQLDLAMFCPRPVGMARPIGGLCFAQAERGLTSAR
jgi:hypothetical protein